MPPPQFTGDNGRKLCTVTVCVSGGKRPGCHCWSSVTESVYSNPPQATLLHPWSLMEFSWSPYLFPILLRQLQFELSVTSDSFKAKPQKHYLSHSINCSAFFGLLQDVIDPSGSFPQHSQRDKHTHAHAHMRQTHTRTRTCTHAHTHTKNKIREK